MSAPKKPTDAPAAEVRSKAASRRRSPAKKGAPQQKKAPPQQPQQGSVGPNKLKGGDGLTEKQRLFVRSYCVNSNATQAAIDAGYSAATAQQAGSRLLQNPAIKAMVEQHRVEANAKDAAKLEQIKTDLGISTERTLLEVRRLAFFDIRKLYNPDGSVKPLHELDDDTAAALTGVDVQELYGGSGDERTVIGIVKKWKASSKDKALEMLMKHQNLYKAENDGKVQPFAEALAGFVGALHSAGGSTIPVRKPVARA